MALAGVVAGDRPEIAVAKLGAIGGSVTGEAWRCLIGLGPDPVTPNNQDTVRTRV